jgi:hypothetical protein
MGEVGPAADHQTMNDVTRNDPPFVPTRAADDGIDRSSYRHPAVLVLAALGIGMLAAAAVGTGVGMLVYSASRSGCYNDGWCELGAAIYGLLGGCLAAVTAHVVAGVIFIRRHRPQGERSLPIVLHLGIPIMLFGLLLALSGL